ENAVLDRRLDAVERSKGPLDCPVFTLWVPRQKRFGLLSDILDDRPRLEDLHGAVIEAGHLVEWLFLDVLGRPLLSEQAYPVIEPCLFERPTDPQVPDESLSELGHPLKCGDFYSGIGIDRHCHSPFRLLCRWRP